MSAPRSMGMAAALAVAAGVALGPGCLGEDGDADPRLDETPPAGLAPSEQAPSEQAPSEQAPSEQAPSKEASSELAPSEQPPSELAPSRQAPSDGGPRMPGPRRGRMFEAVALNATCVRCHEAEAREWKGSHHQRADVNPAYRAAFAIEPMGFCRSCHAPEGDPRRDPPRAVSEIGVACVTCHVTDDGAVLAAPATDPGADDSRAPHPVVRSERFGATGACESCHEFQFPAGRGDEDGQFMQTTVREHARSASAEKGCATCHMPANGRRRGHSFSEVRDPEWLRKNLTVTVERGEDGSLLVTLAQPAPGHGFPTGDLFRRVEVGADLLGPNSESLGRDARHLLRRFEHVPGLPGRQLTADNRLQDEPVTLELTLDPGREVPEGATISWWVTLQRVATVGVGVDPSVARIESEVKLYSGTVPW